MESVYKSYFLDLRIETFLLCLELEEKQTEAWNSDIVAVLESGGITTPKVYSLARMIPCFQRRAALNSN